MKKIYLIPVFILLYNVLVLASDRQAAIQSFDLWSQKTKVPGSYDSKNPEQSTKVYKELFRFLYAGKDLTSEEIVGIPKILQARLEAKERLVLKEEPKENCETSHLFQFINSKTRLGISNSATMIGFEDGLANMETTACLSVDSKERLVVGALEAIWNPQFRRRALKYAEDVWFNPSDQNQLCEKQSFSFAFFDIGTSIYCMEKQNLAQQDISFINMWIVSNKLKAEGASLPIAFNQQLISFQRTKTGLFMHFNSYIRGFHAAGAPQNILKQALEEQQNELIQQLQEQL
jgi:hypothetical protein